MSVLGLWIYVRFEIVGLRINIHTDARSSVCLRYPQEPQLRTCPLHATHTLRILGRQRTSSNEVLKNHTEMLIYVDNIEVCNGLLGQCSSSDSRRTNLKFSTQCILLYLF